NRLVVPAYKLDALNMYGGIGVAVVVDQAENQCDVTAGGQAGETDGDRLPAHGDARGTGRRLAFTRVEERIARCTNCVNQRFALAVEQGRLKSIVHPAG